MRVAHGSRRRLLALVWTLLVATPAAAQHGGSAEPLPPKVYTLDPVTDDQAEAWRADLRALVHELERIHPDPYHTTPKPEFERAVAALDAEVPRLAAHEIVVAFARLLALVGDGHTALPLFSARGVDFHVLPYRLGLYEDGVYVEGADAAYGDLVGGRVVSIGGVPAPEALRRVTPLIARDNDNWIATLAPYLLNRIEVLHALGLADDLSGVEIVVERDGERRAARVAPLPEPAPEPYGLSFLAEYTATWVDARDRAEAPTPLYQRRFEDVYGWEYLPEHGLLYIKWDQAANREAGPSVLDVVREAMAFAREHPPAKTVVDLRNNTGGEGTLARPLIREIVRTPGVDEPGKLFVVIGRRTFSAGQMTTAWFEQFTTATLVGEPSSASYNGYAGHEVAAPLPHSGLQVLVSNAFYQMGRSPHDRRQQATPRLAAIPTFEDYRTNRDPALDAILDDAPDTFVHDVLAALSAGDDARAEAAARAYDARSVNRFAPARSRINALGYRLLREDQTDRAIAVFRLNTRLHPHHANGWDSLGEAYVAAHRRDEAIAAFRQALALQPDLAPSRQWLERLGADAR